MFHLLLCDMCIQGYFKITPNTPGFNFGLLPNDAFGVSVTMIHDVDGDGVDDLAVGSYM